MGSAAGSRTASGTASGAGTGAGIGSGTASETVSGSGIGSGAGWGMGSAAGSGAESAAGARPASASSSLSRASLICREIWASLERATSRIGGARGREGPSAASAWGGTASVSAGGTWGASAAGVSFSPPGAVSRLSTWAVLLLLAPFFAVAIVRFLLRCYWTASPPPGMISSMRARKSSAGLDEGA